MAYYKDLREYIQALENAGKLVRIRRPINKDTELMPLVRWQFRGMPEEERKGFLFENVVDSKGKSYSMPVGVSLLGASRDVYALGLKCSQEEIVDRWIRALANPIEPQLVSTGPVRDVIVKGAELQDEGGGLDKIPIAISTPGFDPAPFLSSAYWVTKDPETGIRNVGVYRAMVRGRAKLSAMRQPRQHIGIHWFKHKQLGKPMEAAIVLGATPVVGMVSVAKIPYGVDEFAVAGGLIGEPLELVKCETVDLEVPATAEIVLEGIISTDYLEPEAPFGEFTGHMGRRILNPVFEIKCITHRANPIYQTFLSQLPPSEASKIRAVSWEAVIYNHLRYELSIPSVIEVALNENCEHDYVGIRFNDPTQDDVWKALEAVADMDPTVAKVVIAVDEDLDPRDSDQITWAMGFRFQPHRDQRVKMVGQRKESLLDPSLGPPVTTEAVNVEKEKREGPSALLINATRKWGFPPVSLPAKQFMENAREIWEAEGLGQLRPKWPWYGYILGQWEEENEEEAELAVKGDYYETGRKLAERRVDV